MTSSSKSSNSVLRYSTTSSTVMKLEAAAIFKMTNINRLKYEGQYNILKSTDTLKSNFFLIRYNICPITHVFMRSDGCTALLLFVPSSIITAICNKLL